MSPFTTNSYGPMIYTKPGATSKNGGRRGGGGRPKQSAYKRLNKDYDIEPHAFIETISQISDLRKVIHLRVKDKTLAEAASDLGEGYIAKIGSDIYIVQINASKYNIYLRRSTRKKAYKRKIKSVITETQ